MENVRKQGKPKRRTVFYVLLTRCARCMNLTELRVETFHPNKSSLIDYCVGIIRDKVMHPLTRSVTHERGSNVLITEGSLITVFQCPRNKRITFVRHQSFAENCPDFTQKIAHHRMPDGERVGGKP